MELLDKDVRDMTDKEVKELRETYSLTTILIAVLDQLQRIRKTQ